MDNDQKNESDIEKIQKYDLDEIIKERKEDLNTEIKMNPTLGIKLSKFDAKKFDIDYDVEKALEKKIQKEKEDLEAKVEFNPNITTKMSDFDVKKFNIDFDVEKALQQKIQKEREKKRLAEINKEPPKKKIYQLSVGEMLIGVKDTWFDILDDILQGRISLSLFNKNNRLFFIGLTICIIVILVYFYYVLTEDESEGVTLGTGVKEVHHIYHVVKSNDQLPSFLTETKSHFSPTQF